jgi:hypothetical protein
MKRYINRNKSWLAIVLGIFLSTAVWAGNDPSIKGNLRSNIQSSMNDFIKHQSIDGSMYVFDAAKGSLLKLKLDKLHSGIVKKGDFYVSCADFKDQQGRKIDIDFLVRPDASKFITTQALVHSVNGNKRKYHLEKI